MLISTGKKYECAITAARVGVPVYDRGQKALELLTLRPSSTQEHLLRADTAHCLMQTLNAVLPFDPAAVIIYAAAVCRASREFSYQYDQMAIDEMQSSWNASWPITRMFFGLLRPRKLSGKC